MASPPSYPARLFVHEVRKVLNGQSGLNGLTAGAGVVRAMRRRNPPGPRNLPASYPDKAGGAAKLGA